MAETFRPVVIERREAERRRTGREDLADRRLGERRDLTTRPTDLRADDVVIDLREAQPRVEVVRDVEEVIARRWFLLAILGALNLLDLVTTKMVLDAGGSEANPVMAPIIHHPYAPALVKTAGFLAVALVLRACPVRSAMVDRALAFVTLLYTAIVSWNLVNLLVHA